MALFPEKSPVSGERVPSILQSLRRSLGGTPTSSSMASALVGDVVCLLAPQCPRFLLGRSRLSAVKSLAAESDASTGSIGQLWIG